MRFAVSAAAAISGLFMLGLAFYGQPALYLHQVREQWHELIDTQTGDDLSDPESDAAIQRMARLQKQVAKLEGELAAKQAADARPTTPQTQQPVPEASLSQPKIDPPKIAESTTLQPAMVEPLISKPIVVAAAQTAPIEPMAPRIASPPPEAAHGTLVRPEQSGPQITPPTPPSTTVAVPERHETALAVPLPPKPEPPKVEQPKAAPIQFGSPKPEVLADELPRTEAPKPPPQKVAMAKPVPAPPPLPQPPPVHPNDDTQSVLARLRQLAPASAPVQQPDVLPPVEPQPRPLQPQSLPGLTAARAALASGRIEDARRLLQQAQLQLVFRPMSASGDDSPWAAKAAADVAHALEALSTNDVQLSRRYVDVAVGDLSGTGTGPPNQELPLRTSGYAPAYPPH